MQGKYDGFFIVYKGNVLDTIFFCVSEKFWTAPELLKADSKTCPSPETDIYSVGVILKEMFCRNSPYSEYDLEPEGKIQDLK